MPKNTPAPKGVQVKPGAHIGPAKVGAKTSVDLTRKAIKKG